jgi:cobalamin synthase
MNHDNPLGKIGRAALWLTPIVIVAAFIALWWVKQQSPAAASVLAPVVGISLMVYVTLMSSRQQRRLDEVQIASQGFANTHGFVGGATVTVLLLMLPPVTNWLIDLVNTQSTGSPDTLDRVTVRLAFIYGVCLVVAMQTLCGLVAAAIWWRRMGGVGERP